MGLYRRSHHCLCELNTFPVKCISLGTNTCAESVDKSNCFHTNKRVNQMGVGCFQRFISVSFYKASPAPGCVIYDHHFPIIHYQKFPLYQVGGGLQQWWGGRGWWSRNRGGECWKESLKWIFLKYLCFCYVTFCDILCCEILTQDELNV